MNNTPDHSGIEESDCLSSAPENFDWPRCPEADAILKDLARSILQYHQFAGNLARRMESETSTRFFDWLDHLRLPPDHPAIALLKKHGFVEEECIEKKDETQVLWHSHANFPRIVIDPYVHAPAGAIQVESVNHFCIMHRLHNTGSHPIEGDHGSSLRQTHIDEGINRFTVLERHGYRGFVPQKEENPGIFDACAKIWHERRGISSPDPAYHQILLEHKLHIAQLIALRIGQPRATDVVLSTERNYWMSSNTAGRIQKQRLDTLGLGWGAIRDHHTFRSSRENFLGLMQIFLALGFKKRERYYAGDAHGWGAQIMEHPITGDVLFLDVDLFPDEAGIDFSVQPLSQRSDYRTVGRWCAIHGDSILQAGMHHLEAKFDFAALKRDLEKRGIQTMDKFTDFPELQQAFTFGERWPVDPDYLKSALQKSAIDQSTFDRIYKDSHAIGSHLENLERNHGYKGFNKSGVDAILRAVDPQRVAVQKDIATTLSIKS